MSLMMCTRTGRDVIACAAGRPRRWAPSRWRRLHGCRPASTTRACSSPGRRVGSAPPARGRSRRRARASSSTTTAAKSGPGTSPPSSAACRCSAPTSPTSTRSTGSSQPRARRSAGSTCAPRSPASGPRRTCRYGGSRSSAGSRPLRQNLTATFLTARGFLREVERNGAGSLVLVGSTAGAVGEAGHADYAAAKSALQGGLLLSLKNEIVRVAPRARVNAVAPGWTESPMTRGHVDPESVRRDLADDGAAQGRAAGGRRAPGRRARLRRALGPRHRAGRHDRRRHGGPRRSTRTERPTRKRRSEDRRFRLRQAAG